MIFKKKQEYLSVLIQRLGFSSGLISNIAKMSLGLFVSYAVGFFSLPVISFFYSPEDLGLFGLFLASSSILSIIFTLRFEVAIPLPAEVKNALVVIFITSFFTVSTLILCYLGI